MLLVLFQPMAKDLFHLIGHEQRQTGAKGLPQFRRQGKKSAERGFSCCYIAGIEDFTKHGLLMRDIGVSRLAFIAPKSPVIAYNDLGLRGHPGLSPAHGLARLAVEFGLESDMFVKQPRWQCEHDLSCGDLNQQVFAPELKPDGISPFGHADQGIFKLYIILG